jgi:ATP-dependent Clp protease adaptor protein ClpS
MGGGRKPVSMSNEPFEQEEVGVATDSRTEVRRPPLYKVLLHNDDYTTMEFVVLVLETVFRHSRESAFQIMMHVHERGVGVAGLFPFEAAEAKVETVHSLAREHDFPLQCSLEPE